MVRFAQASPVGATENISDSQQLAARWIPAFAGMTWKEKATSADLLSHVLPVIRRLAGDRDVVHMALAQPGIGDPHKGAVLLHLGARAVAGVAHRRAQAADQLVDDVADRPLVGDAAFDPFGDEFERVGDFLL